MRNILFVFILSYLFVSCDSNNRHCDIVEDKLSEKTYPYYGRFLERAFPDKEINWKAYINAKEEITFQILNNQKSLIGFDNEWETQGPGNIGARVNSVAIHPNDNNIIFAGFSGGGLWKTIDGGENWRSVFDDNAFLAIGDIQFSKENPNHVFVGTGDPNVSGLPSIGNGLFKSEDLGETWKYLGLEEQRIISKIELDPNDPNVIYTSSMGLPFTRNDSRGVYKSEDGGNSWDQVLSISDSTGFADVIVNPDNSNIVLAAGWDRVRSNTINLVVGETGGIYRSEDAGQNWNKIEAGIQFGAISRSGLTICKNVPNNVYAVIVNINQELQGIYRSIDYGASFDTISISELPDNVLGGFGWYFGKIAVDPNDPDHIFVLGVDLFETRDAGESWSRAAPAWWMYDVHADKHDLQILDNGQMYLATDGGLYQKHIDSSDWVDIENIPATQFYRTAYNPHFPDTYYGGAQDNGTTSGNKSTINEWLRVYGGDGFQMVFDPIDPLHYFVESQRGNINVTDDGGYSYSNATDGLFGKRDWDMQYIMSPHDNNILFTGTDFVFVSFDSYDVSWQEISGKMTSDELVGGSDANITTITESPLRQGVLYIGTNDGLVHGTQDMGGSWTLLSNDLPKRYVTDVVASPYNESWAYVCFSGYKDNDNIARIHKTRDYGQSWEDISNNLPDIAVNDILVIPGTQDNLIFLATDGGVYGSTDAGDNWERLGINMPNINVYDLAFNEEKEELIASTYARSIMTYNIAELFAPSTTLEEIGTALNIQLYPNPTINQVDILVENNKDLTEFEFQLIDNNGKNIETSKVFRNNKITMDLSHLNTGVYYLKYTENNKIKTKSLFKL